MQYQQRLNRVIDYIYQRLREQLTLEQLAEQAWMSPWHFHRTYRLLAEDPVSPQLPAKARSVYCFRVMMMNES